MKYFLAQVVCYAGDGVLWTKLYATDNPDVIKYIDEIAQCDADKDHYGDSGRHSSYCLNVREIKIEKL